MATFTFTTTVEQDAALSTAVSREPGASTARFAYVNAGVRDVLLTPVVERRLQRVADWYRHGTAAQRAAVDAALGIV